MTRLHDLHLCVIRCLDGMMFGLLGLLLIMAYETFAVVTVGQRPTLVLVIPVAALAIATFQLPVGRGVPSSLESVFVQLKYVALCLLGMAPFVSWMARGHGGWYLLIGGTLALLAAASHLLLLLSLLELIFAAGGDRYRARLAKWVRWIAVYVYVTPVVATFSMVAWERFRYPVLAVGALPYAWSNLRPWIRLAVMGLGSLPVLGTLHLLVGARHAVATIPIDPPVDEDCQCPSPAGVTQEEHV